MKKWALLGLLWFVTLPARAELPQLDPVPGGIVAVRVAALAVPAPQVLFQQQRVMVVAHQGAWYAVLGVPLDLEPGEHDLEIVGQDAMRVQPFTVRPKAYAVQRIALKNPRLVDPLPEDLTRIEHDQAVIRDSFGHWSELETPPLHFDLPAQGRVSGNFGLRRFFNDQPRQPHSGVDIAAPLGTVVVAPAGGVVVATGDYFFNGQTIFLDHGQGLISMFNHLSRIDVVPGAKVERGQPIGKVGMTGRVTGPHLHWTVSLNNARVNPLLLVGKAQTKRIVHRGM